MFLFRLLVYALPCLTSPHKKKAGHYPLPNKILSKKKAPIVGSLFIACLQYTYKSVFFATFTIKNFSFLTKIACNFSYSSLEHFNLSPVFKFKKEYDSFCEVLQYLHIKKLYINNSPLNTRLQFLG